MNKNIILDHHYIEDEHESFYVVYGNTHPPGRLHAYLKYMPVERRTPWCRRNKCYERVVRHYELSEMIGSPQRLEYEPMYGVEIPMLRLTGRERIYDPRRRILGMVSKPLDPLELRIVEFLDALKGVVPLSSLGVTGSTLIGIHNPSISDADITVYGCRDTLRLIEYLRETGLLVSLGNAERLEWGARIARRYGESLDWALSLYRPWRRGVFRNITISVIPVDDRVKRYGEPVYRGYKCVSARVSVEGLQCGALYTPARVSACILDSLERHFAKGRVEILSFEGAYSPMLYEGGVFLVRGELAYTGEANSILVGTRRCGGVIHKIQAS